MRIATGLVVVLVACGGPPSTASGPASAPAASALPPLPPIVGVIDAGAAAAPVAPRRPSTCRAVGAGEVSDDDAPIVSGTKGTAAFLEWLEAHGVGKDAALAWLVARYKLPDAAYAESVMAPMTCSPLLTVGDKPEEALFCAHSVPNPSVQEHAVVLVVRGRRIVPVLALGLGVRSLDFPDAHTLDLAVEVAPDGRTVTLRERAPEGSKLVLAPSACRAAEADWDACDAKLASAPDLEQYAHRMANGHEYFDAYDGCALARGADGRIRTVRVDLYADHFALPAVLHGCAAAKAQVAATTRDVASAPAAIRNEVRETAAFVERSCAQRGTWEWKGDRFVKK